MVGDIYIYLMLCASQLQYSVHMLVELISARCHVCTAYPFKTG